MYWKHKPPSSEEVPDAVIDLRRVRRLSVDGLEMALKFSSRTYTIKAGDEAQIRFSARQRGGGQGHASARENRTGRFIFFWGLGYRAWVG